jgi:hypothetical protein
MTAIFRLLELGVHVQVGYLVNIPIAKEAQFGRSSSESSVGSHGRPKIADVPCRIIVSNGQSSG